MDIQQYISSGLIEAYVLGIASEEEVRELELLSAQHPEIADAVSDCRQTMEHYASLHVVPPPQKIKDALWAQLKEEKIADEAPAMPIADAGSKAAERQVYVNRNDRSRLAYRALAASVVFLLGSIALNFIFWNRSRVADREMVKLKETQLQLGNANQEYQQQLQETRQSLQLLTDPAVKSIMLAGVEGHTANSAVVLWDSRSKDVYLSLKEMPPPPKGKQYQLWAIVEGKPVDLGVYGLGREDSMQKMKRTESAEMFAITLEQEGGSPTPTLDQMFVAGKL